MAEVSFWVSGKPEPQGSTKAFVVNGRPVVTSDNPNLKAWRDLIASQVQGLLEAPFAGPVLVGAAFYLPRPKSLPKKVTQHTKKPDLDKLQRSLGDAITHVLVRDDSQVVRWMVSKHYADDGKVGCYVVVREMGEEKDGH